MLRESPVDSILNHVSSLAAHSIKPEYIDTRQKITRVVSYSSILTYTEHGNTPLAVPFPVKTHLSENHPHGSSLAFEDSHETG